MVCEDKKAYFFIGALYLLLLEMQIVLMQVVSLYLEAITTEQLIGVSAFMVIMILLSVVSAFHATLSIVFTLYQLSQL